MIPLVCKPIQTVVPSKINLSNNDMVSIDDCISNLVSIGAVELVSKSDIDQFISNIFCVPKPDGRFRLILNLKKFNNFVLNEHFKMEDHRSVSNLLSQDCYLATVDLKDAYHFIPIVSGHRKYLRFTWKDRLFQYTCPPFGLCTSARVFTKVLKPVVEKLRSEGIICSVYLDDILICAET